jgi:hypothetical protein
VVQAHLADQLVGRCLAVFADHVGDDQLRAVAVVATAEADLGFQQLARLVQGHITIGGR